MPQGAFSHQNPPLFEVRDLAVDLAGFTVLSEVSFQVEQGSIAGLFGESGCGKTTLALALGKLLAPARYRVRGAVLLNGRDLLSEPERELERIRGAEIAFIFQDPLLALNPVLRVRQQVGEVIRAHGRAAESDVEAALRLAGLAPSRRMLDAYPHQLSGGERQRVAIAQALACRPALVIADEPFTALDVTLAVDLAGLFRALAEKLGTAFLVIGHSPGVLARIADQVLVMYGGRIVERGTPRQVFRDPLHPYTAALMRSLPRPGAAEKRLYTIPGEPPGLRGRGHGCPFEPRCGVRVDRCAAAMPGESGRVRCFQYGT